MCMQVPFEASDGSQVFEGERRDFQTDDSENARLVSYRSMRGHGGIKLLEPYLLEDLVKNERMYSGVFPLHTLNIITALSYFSCFVNGRSLKFLVCHLWV